MTAPKLLYSDTLVEITENSICFKDYYFPVGPKRVPFTDITDILVVKPTWLNGRYRLQGTGNFQTWFPLDWHRPSRPEIFFASLRGTSRRIGFTVEAAAPVQTILRDMGLLR